MKKSTGSTYSVWMHGVTFPGTVPLQANLTCDVCVVGAGIAGLTTAYLLAQEGKSVVVLESKAIGSGETSRTTAHLSNALDDRYHQIRKMHGDKIARLAAESHTQAIRKIAEIAQTEKIECDFEWLNGYLFLHAGESEEQLDKELEAVRFLGFQDVVKLQQGPYPALSQGGVLCFPNQAIFHPMKYLAGLSRAILDKAGQIYTETHVTAIQEAESNMPHRVMTANGFTVTANQVVVATNTPMNDKYAIHTKQAPYRSYVLGFRIMPGSVPNALYWDDADPYHYIRLVKDSHPDSSPGEAGADAYNVLLVGGEDHKTGQAEDEQERLDCLETWAREKFPTAGDVIYRWSGQVMEPVDYQAFIGRNPGDEHVYIATGDSGHGMTHGTIAGILITDLILGRPNAWEAVYDPGRVTFKSGGEFLRENLNVAAQYRDYMTPGEVSEASEVAPGTGAVIRRGAAKVAVYCDAQGNRHERSAVCPHLGCIVHWNTVEKSWDCPCHGSRFDPQGNFLSGPANKDLEKSDT